jgi:hypothetical protein
MGQSDKHATQTKNEGDGVANEECASDSHKATISPFWRA